MLGIIKKMDYLEELGINAIYLNPIFQSPSNHRYNTYDYFKIDPKLGSLDDFKFLLNAAHKKNIHVILDGVFNHCGRGFFAFNDLLENGIESPYLDWFLTKSFPLNAYSPGKAEKYEAWWHIKSLPKFNTNNPEVRDYLFDVAAYWIGLGADGWRLDVPNEINDLQFWREFCEKVRAVNNNTYILGEIWEPDRRWIEDGLFDGLMNYPLRSLVIQAINDDVPNILDLSNYLNHFFIPFSPEKMFFSYHLLDSHDTERIFTSFNGSLQKIKLAYLFLFSLPGAPSIYYGDEIGLQGGKDPGCRGTFDWNESNWNIELRNWIKRLIVIRKQNEILRSGDLSILNQSQIPGMLALVRSLKTEKLLSIFNFSNQVVNYKLSFSSFEKNNNSQFYDLLNEVSLNSEVDGLLLSLPPLSGKLIRFFVN